MCHSNLEIELGDFVNFITGQNGSGKSAILTALCVAFGCRAKGTQRANAMKDFIKTGCSYALIHIEMKNQGEDAFKPEQYGDIIIIERRILESTSTTVLKNWQGKKVGAKREELLELVEHFNIDVENPCVIMSQDRSREFLHSGNNKDRFKFYFKATLLQQLGGLLDKIGKRLNQAAGLVDQMEQSLNPFLKELDDLQLKIRSMEQVEEISQEVLKLKKKLAWSWVYDVDKQLGAQTKQIEMLKDRIPKCQAKIDAQKLKMEELKDQLTKKKAEMEHMLERTSEVRRMKDQLQQTLQQALKETIELEGERDVQINRIRVLDKRLKSLEQQIHDMLEVQIKNTQAEESEMEEKLKAIQDEIDEGKSILERLKEKEDSLLNRKMSLKDEMETITSQIGTNERKYNVRLSEIRDLQRQQNNKVTAFGGDKVITLLQVIERHYRKFRCPPIGPIGAHLSLVHEDDWAVAVENAMGSLFNAFIVTDHQDSLCLRECAKEAQYRNLRIIIYEFSRPRLNIPSHMLPQTHHPTAISELKSDNPTVMNVLVDMGNGERQVLVKDYKTGIAVAFDQRIPNLKEVYTSDGYRMFSRGSSQTILPPSKSRGRLCSSYDNRIKSFEMDASDAKRQAEEGRGRKRKMEEALLDLENKIGSAKRRRYDAEQSLRSKDIILQDLKKLHAVDTNPAHTSSVDEFHQEIHKVRQEKQEKEILLEKVQMKLNEAQEKENSLKTSFENLCGSAKLDLDAFQKAESDHMEISEEFHVAEATKIRFEDVMCSRVLPDIKAAESQYHELEENRKENYRKASIICPEDEIEALGGCGGSTPEEISAELSRLNRRLQHESQRFPDSIDDLRMFHEKKRRKIVRKQQTYKAFKEKVNACEKALDLRQRKFDRNATLAVRELTWKFNSHLGRKGISGSVSVDYEEETLSIEVIMPQDASNKRVCDTRGLSGGERSFSTLCFTMALHEMTEATFRAMDEFDVFMDAVSRKISLDTLVDFALAQGSQWIFITPHDISMVKQDERIKKQQMAAPRA